MTIASNPFRKASVRTLLLCIACLASLPAVKAETQVFDSPGSSSWTVPAGVTEVTIRAWGAGGGGDRGGGGAGAYAQDTVAVVPGETLTVTVGAGGGAQQSGGLSAVSRAAALVRAAGGTRGGNLGGGAGGTIAASLGSIRLAGCSGGTGANVGNSPNGGGGGGGGTPSATTPCSSGGNASNPNRGSGGIGFGNGGDGGEQGRNALAGQAPGGGGGGAGRSNSTEGAGGHGRVEISYVQPPPPGVHHIRLLHDGEALTCLPATVTLLACEDEDCDTLYADEISVTLTPGGWVGGDTISFTNGTATAQLRRTTPGMVTLGVEESAPEADNPPRCFNGAVETCTLGFAEAGFVVEVPDLVADRPDGPVRLRAVKQADDGVSCAPAFSGARTVNFWTGYENPASGTMPVRLDGAAIATSAPGTGLALDFDANAVATIAAIRYADAGQLRLHARLVGAGNEAGLVMTGSGLFVSRPLGLAVVTGAANADCAAADHNCSVFRRAGEDFDLTVRGVAWTHDGDADLNDNPTTPNYRQNGVVLGHQLIAPLPGNPGSLGLAVADIGNLGETTVAQHVSEVGVFRFTATPPANAYFGYTVGAGVSADIGRFIPHDLSPSVEQPGLLPSACSAFSYSGQTMEGWSAEPRIGIRPRNAAGGTTTNYRDGFMRLLPAGLSFALPDTDDSATGVDGTPLPVAAAKQAGSLDEAGGGILRYSFSLNDSLSYQRTANARVAPFVADLSWRLIGLSDQDGVPADGLPLLIRPDGVEIRYGRLALEPAHGSERTDLLMTAYAEYWNGFAYATNTADFCTPALPAELACAGQIGPVTCAAVLVEEGGNLIDGKSAFRLRAPNATGTLGYTLGAPPWLRFDWNNDGNHDDPAAPATFGIYEGNPNMIHMREIWR